MVKNLPANAGDSGSIPGLGRTPGEGNGYPLQYFLPGDFHGQEPGGPTVHGVTKSQTLPSTHPQAEGTGSHSFGNSQPAGCLKMGCGLIFASFTA